MAPSQPPTRTWWKESSIYQIYPSSFLDTTSSGVGDIPGVISKLDYIKNLGIDIVWICPIYKSPQVDMGYDIEDYREIHEPYGTMGDVERLIEGCHERGMKFLMDLVVNHTSDKHKWFLDAKTGKNAEFRDFYMWRKPKYDAEGKRHPPNNWLAMWGGSAWEYDEPSDEYYLHLFAPEQPDLNWENPRVREEVHDIIRFWLDKGVDGFRCDVINFISKVPGLPDASITRPDQEYQPGEEHFACGPRLHEYLQAIGKILKEYNAFSVGEMPSVHDPKEIINAVGSDRGELNMIFHFEIVDMDQGTHGKFSPNPWTLPKLKKIINKWQRFMIDNNGWNALYLENHDQSRSVSRWGSDELEYREYCAKMFATFMCLQSGSVFVYQGQELGMINIPKERKIEEYRDLETRNAWREILERHPNDKALQKLTLSEIQKKSRDNARTPMQWTSTPPNAGFTSPTTTPWQKVNESHLTINAALQTTSPNSVYAYWKTILALRKEYKDLFIYGDFALLDEADEDVFAYKRFLDGRGAVVVVCNFRKEVVGWKVGGGVGRLGGKVVGNYDDEGGEGKKEGETLSLRPFEAGVWFCE